MSTDPRVMAMAEALEPRCMSYQLNRTEVEGLAEVAVAALDAYDEPKFRSVVHECCERPVEADLRERIAAEIEANACVVCQKAGRAKRGARHTPCGYWFAAARIARGETP